MTREQFDEWVTKYGKAWEALDAEAVMSMMSRDNLTYFESTFNEPTTDWEAVRELWQVVPENQTDVTFWHEILMCDNDKALAHVKITRTLLPSNQRQDIDAAFVFGIDPDGRCTYFRQWRMVA